jgi:Flp pilus assembly protein TadG
VLPIFCVIVFGLIDGGRLVFANSTVSQAAREAVRLAVVQAPFIGATGGGCMAPVCPASTTDFHANVVAAASRMSVVVGPVPSANLHVLCTVGPPGTWTSGNDCSANNVSGSGNYVSVRISVPIQPLLPIFGWFYPSSISAAATMAIP